jgi:hypothetical protein
MVTAYRLVNRNLDNYKLLNWNELKLWNLMKQLIFTFNIVFIENHPPILPSP